MAMFPRCFPAAAKIQMPPGPVTYRWPASSVGLLHTEPGKLTIRHSLAQDPHIILYDGERSVFKTGVVTALYARLPLGPVDLACRVVDGVAFLHVEPTAGKAVWLTLWSEDTEALPRALERFWSTGP